MLGNILAVGLMSMGMGLSGIKDEPQMYIQDEATYTITYENANDWKSRANSIYTWLDENNYDSSNVVTITGNVNVADTDYTINAIFKAQSGTTIILQRTDYEIYRYNIETQIWTQNSNEVNPTEITITSQTYYEALAEASMGSDIVGTIASGLGIIGALATTFLTGFGNLLYSSGALTPFAIFALVMLGIAVSFAVVKLVLNLIRSNTGA